MTIHNSCWPNSTGGMYKCTVCGQWLYVGEIHICTGATIPNSWPTITTPSTKDNIVKHINWQEYVPARPPESGLYIVVYKDIKNNEGRDTFCCEYNAEEYRWVDVLETFGADVIVTHYAKLDLP